MTLDIGLVVGNAALIGVILCIARNFENRNPIEANQSTAAIVVDYKLSILKYLSSSLITPASRVWAIMIVNAAGGGWIHLRTDGWWFLFSSIVVIIALELWSYFVHRASHRFGPLWAMHSLHHSAEALSMVTGARHFWLEDPLLNTAFPVMAILFTIPPEIATTLAFVYFLTEGMVHLNLRVSLGRCALWLNNPQYHRIHHSVEPQHQDKNFCKMLPLIDVIFGTAWKPGQDEFPRTGVSGEKATGVLDGLMWPLRHRIPVLSRR